MREDEEGRSEIRLPRASAGRQVEEEGHLPGDDDELPAVGRCDAGHMQPFPAPSHRSLRRRCRLLSASHRRKLR